MEALDLLTIEQAAEYLTVTPNYVRRLVRDKKLGHFRLGDRRIRIQKQDVLDYLERSRVAPEPKRVAPSQYDSVKSKLRKISQKTSVEDKDTQRLLKELQEICP